MAQTYGLERFVDAGSLARGMIYAVQGKSEIISHVQGWIEASTSGSGGKIYRQWINYEPEGAQLVQFSGSCTCPVGYNCKHCVSAAYIALDLLPSSITSAAKVPARSGWKRELDDVFGVLEDDPSPLAIAIDFAPPRPVNPDIPIWKQRSAGHLHAFPLRMGKRRKWVKSGISFAALRPGRLSGYVPEHVAAIGEFIAACELGAGSSVVVGSDSILLNYVKSPFVGDLMRNMIAAGVELVNANGYKRVVIDDDPIIPFINLADRGGALEVVTGISHPRMSADYMLIGQPSQAAVWDTDELRLAWFDPVPSGEWSRFANREVTIPAADRGEFERDYLPRLRESAPILTDNYELPAPVKPRLRLTLTTTAGEPHPNVRAVWEWAYGDEHSGRVHPLWSTPDSTRQEDEESEILDRAVGTVDELCPAMIDGTLVGTSTIRGEDLLLLTPLIEQLRAEGVEVIDDGPAYHRANDVQVSLDVEESRDWLDLTMRVVVDGTQVEIAQLLRALASRQNYLYINGAYVDLDSDDLAKLKALIAEARQLGDARRRGLRVPKVRRSWWEELLDLGIVETSQHRWFAAVRNAPEPGPIEVPKTLEADLRPYQVEGFQWLAHLRQAGLGGLLADDMGLGKTLQMLAMILRDREQKAAHGEPSSPWLVVAPTSVVSNWVSEARKFTPSLNVVGIEATERIRGQSLAEVTGGADVVVTSYTLMRLEAEDYRQLGITGLVLDEAQNVKNPKSKGFAVAASLGAPTVFAVTGTPIENNLTELWAMFALAAPGLLGSAEKFGDAFRKPIEKAAGLTGPRSEDARELMNTLRRRISPFLLRRTKDAVALDLPPKQEQVLTVELASAHRRLYDVQLEKERQRVLGLSDEDRIEILSALTRLRQLAIDPRLVDEQSQAPPSKLDELAPLVGNLVAEGHTVLVFSQFTRFLKLIVQRLVAEGIEYLYLDGSTKNRADLIERFGRGEAPVFLISLKAGGTGLNLTMADYAILTDPWWNPAAEEQAVDRAHRIGQTRPVHVYRMVSRGTIEEKVVALQDAKRRLLGVISNDAGSASSGLSAAELRALLD
ncbi:superfamily II DNA or RNA helicase [Trueperella bonasi]|uniref:Superfamily II DNA or RNA helicase n=1 Tax=Trueperella bonasi TaxID=312286 RepID=A0ABT9NHW2_9ACTO|nr:DEAD/DEAH box helicase [Trueperella bonasi]MDP9806977.1 superfamily II DNA or RNA helicase [Trueperella bonasi]